MHLSPIRKYHKCNCYIGHRRVIILSHRVFYYQSHEILANSIKIANARTLTMRSEMKGEEEEEGEEWINVSISVINNFH